MKTTKMKEKILSLNLDPKKELIKYLAIVIILILSAGFAYFFLKNLLIIFGGLALVLVFTYAYTMRYSLIIEDKRKRLEYEFVEVFSYIRIYLVNQETVYSAIKKASEYSSKDMQKKIDEFVNRVDEDKSIVPFLDFANYFHNKTIEEVMISLYQMIDGGFTEAYLNQFINIFENFRNRLNNEKMIKKNKSLNTLNQFSLVGSAYLMFVILLVVVSLLGELTDGF